MNDAYLTEDQKKKFISSEEPTFMVHQPVAKPMRLTFQIPVVLIISMVVSFVSAMGQGRFLEKQALNEAPMLFLNANYAIMTPMGDLSDRFGTGFSAGGQVEIMTWPGNWIFGIDGQFGFAGKVKENVLDFLQDEDENIVGRDVAISQAFLQQRLVSGKLVVGKLIPLIRANKRSGLRLTLGGGYQFHWIKVNDELKSLAQIEGEYGKGYDRLTGGILLSEFIGYQHVSLNRRLNFYAGVDFGQAFGSSLRSYDYATMQTDDRSRVDLTLTFRLGWCIPLWTGTGSTDIYY